MEGSSGEPATAASESPMFLGKRAEELSWLIERQVGTLFEAEGIEVPVRSCSLLLQLHRSGEASAADLAKALGISHQLVLQKIPALLGHQLIDRRADPEDRRRRIFCVTAKGSEQAERLIEHRATISELYRTLYEEIGVDLFDAIGRALDALKARNLGERLDASRSP